MESPGANVTIREADTIWHEEGGWFDARWHFSFDRYRDPEQLGVGAGGTHDLEPAIGPILEGVRPLLHARLEVAGARQDPELDESQTLRSGSVLLRMLVAAMRERHHLRGAGLELSVVPE